MRGSFLEAGHLLLLGTIHLSGFETAGLNFWVKVRGLKLLSRNFMYWHSIGPIGLIQKNENFALKNYSEKIHPL